MKKYLTLLLIATILLTACGTEKISIGGADSVNSESEVSNTSSEDSSANESQEDEESSKNEVVAEADYLPIKIADDLQEVVNAEDVPEALKKELKMLYPTGYITSCNITIYNKITKEYRSVSLFSADNDDTNYNLSSDEFIGGYTLEIYTNDDEAVIESYYNQFENFTQGNGIAEFSSEFENEYGFGEYFFSDNVLGEYNARDHGPVQKYMIENGLGTQISAGCEFIPNN